MALTRSYLGTNAVGSVGLAMNAGRHYVKQITMPALSVLATVEPHIQTTDGNDIALRPVLHADNGTDPGNLIGFHGSEVSAVRFNGRDDWTALPIMYPFTASTEVWAGVHAPDITGLSLSHETTGGGGINKRINTFGATYTSEVGGASASLTDDSHLYSIRFGVIEGFSSFSQVGRTTVGAAWLALADPTVYVVKVSVPADRLILGIRAHVRHHTLNGSNLAATLWADNAGVPGTLLHAGPHGAGMFLAQDVGRDLHFPVGLWNAAAADYWIGLRMAGSAAFELAFDSTGGAGGTKASLSDAATFTAGDDNYSMHLVLAA